MSRVFVATQSIPPKVLKFNWFPLWVPGLDHQLWFAKQVSILCTTYVFLPLKTLAPLQYCWLQWVLQVFADYGTAMLSSRDECLGWWVVLELRFDLFPSLQCFQRSEELLDPIHQVGTFRLTNQSPFLLLKYVSKRHGVRLLQIQTQA